MVEHKRIWAILLWIGFGTTVLYGRTLTKTFQSSLPMQTDKTVVVENRNGSIEVRAWDGDSVHVLAEIEVKAGSLREAKRAIKDTGIDVESQEGDILISADYPEQSDGWHFWDWVFGRNVQVNVRFILDVPKTASLEVKTVNGKVLVDGLQGPIDAHTTNGRIDIRNVGGEINAVTVNGSISARLIKLDMDRSVSLRTTNGSVRIGLPVDVHAEVRASTVNGSVSTDYPMEVQGQFTGKRIEGEINGGGGLIVLKAVNGSIYIEKE